MSADTPERLREFRYERARHSRAYEWLRLVAAFLTGVCVCAAAWVFASPETLTGSRAAVGGLEPARLRELAVHLERKGLARQAIAAYAEYLSRAAIDDPERAGICYTIAQAARERGDHETALAYLYEAEFLGVDGPLQEDVSNQIIACLDRLGRKVDMRRELRARTGAHEPDPAGTGGEDGEVVLATYDDKRVTLEDFERAVEALPETSRDRLASPEERAAFLRRLLAERVLDEAMVARKAALYPERLEGQP